MKPRPVDWVAVVAIVVVVLGLFLLEPVAEQSAPKSASVAQAMPVTQALSAETPAATTSVAGLDAPEEHAGQVRVCAYGWRDRNPAGSVDAPPLEVSEEHRQARQRLLDLLETSESPLTRGVGVLERATQQWEARPQAPTAEDRLVVQRQAAVPYFDKLAELAASHSDPRLYALALRACRKTPGTAVGPHCATLSAAQWSRLDPDDAAPWLFALEDAEKRKDKAGVDEALFHIGQSKRWSESMFTPGSEVARLTGPSEADVLAAFESTVATIGMAAAQTSAIGLLPRVCRGEALADANRRQLCEQAAETMTERSESMLVAAIGLTIGRNVGWPQTRIDAVRGLTQAVLDPVPAGADAPWVDGCAEMRAHLERIARLGRIGELGVARETIAASGRSLEDYAKDERNRRIRREAAAASPASSSSASQR